MPSNLAAALAPVYALRAAELIALYVIRDNLTLNVLMILHRFDAIRDWQAARGA